MQAVLVYQSDVQRFYMLVVSTGGGYCRACHATPFCAMPFSDLLRGLHDIELLLVFRCRPPLCSARRQQAVGSRLFFAFLYNWGLWESVVGTCL